jgi:hypothetical protein
MPLATGLIIFAATLIPCQPGAKYCQKLPKGDTKWEIEIRTRHSSRISYPESRFLFVNLEYMRYRRRACAAQVLGHADGRPGYLAIAGRSTQLLNQLDDLVDARRADGVATSLQATEGADGNAAVASDLAVAGQLPARASRRETAGLQRQRGHDGIGVVQLEDVDVVGRHPGRFHRLATA